MVNKPYRSIVLTGFLLFSVILFPIYLVGPQSISYHIGHEYAKLWINDDGSIDLLYEIKILVDSGRISSDIFIGMPNEDFTLGEAFTADGTPLTIVKDFEEGAAVDVKLKSPIYAGGNLTFNLTINVEKMVYLDETNPGNVGLQFIPTWWDGVVEDLRILIILPEGSTSENVRNQPDYDNILQDTETGRLMLYWERKELAPGEKFAVGVSFPKELVKEYQIRRVGIEAFIYDSLLPALPILVLLIILVVGFILVIRRILKTDYVKPSVKIESLGVRRGLTAVEAGWLLGLGPVKIIVSILYSLLHKKAIWVAESDPRLKIEMMPEFKDPIAEKASSLRYYEIMFLEAVSEDKTLDEGKLVHTVTAVRDTVEQKMKGYNRDETIQYYRTIVEKAWKQVTDAGTPELASQAFDENLFWLYMDERFGDRLKETLSERVLIPDPVWWWYWWWARPGRTPPTMRTPGDASKPTPLPGAEVADRIVTSIEKSANGIVSNLEKFADAIAPAKASTKKSPVRRGSGGFCACASCACACACVSCACACAGGRVR